MIDVDNVAIAFRFTSRSHWSDMDVALMFWTLLFEVVETCGPQEDFFSSDSVQKKKSVCKCI